MTGGGHVTAFEHEAIPISSRSGVGLTPAEADVVQEISEDRPGFCSRGVDTLRFAQYCGVVALGARTLEVLPKLDRFESASSARAVLLRLLRLVEDVAAFRHLPSSQALVDAPLLEIFVSAFFDEVAQVVRGGLLRLYREHDDDLAVVRGRIVMKRQLGILANRRDQVACRFDELTADNGWNRATKAAVAGVRSWIHSSQLNRRWIELMGTLDEVASVDLATQDMDRLVPSRQAVRYRTVITWARWIQALQAPAIRGGSHKAPGWLFDMNAVFESAVTACVRVQCEAAGLQLRSQDRGTYLAKLSSEAGVEAIALRPDIVVRRGREIVAIADAKWKVLGVGGGGFLMPPESDVYQAHSYAAGFGCDRVALVYPWHAGLSRSVETRLELPPCGGLKPVVTVVCVDLDQDALPPRRGANWAT